MGYCAVFGGQSSEPGCSFQLARAEQRHWKLQWGGGAVALEPLLSFSACLALQGFCF